MFKLSAILKPILFAAIFKKPPTTGNVITKPSIFATIIGHPPVTGNVITKPLIFATIIEHPPVTGNIITKPSIFATIKSKEVFNGDTLREITGEDENIFYGDTLRRICEKFSGDTLRVIKNYEIFSGDTCRELREVFSGDTERKIVKTEKFLGDTIIRVPYILKYMIEELPEVRSASPKNLKSFSKTTSIIEIFINTLKDLNITSLNINLNEMTLSDTISLESATHMNINEAIKGQLFNYKYDFLVEETSHQDLIQTIKGMYNQDELLYTQFYLTNNTIANLLNEEEKQNIIDSNNELLTYLQIAKEFQFNGKDAARKEFLDYYVAAHLPVSSFVKFIAQALGLRTNIQMQDFRHKNLVNNIGSYITYADFLTQAFNWTSQIPQYQVNCFIRGDTLNVIMRGYENAVYDITNIPHTRPTITKKLLRNLWSNAIDDSTLDENTNDDEEPIYFTGELGDDGSLYTFVNGLLRSENHSRYYTGDLHTSEDETSEYFNSVTEETRFRSSQYITYDYTVHDEYSGLEENYKSVLKFTPPDKLELNNDEREKIYYLAGKSEQSIDEQWREFDPDDNEKTIHYVDTSYGYTITKGEGIYLSKEDTTSKKYSYVWNKETWGYKLDSIEEQVTETRHSPLGNGFYSTVTYQNGILQGSSVSQGKPSQEVSRYTIQQVQKAFSGNSITDTDSDISNRDDRSRLKAIVNTTFPIVEENIKEACVDAMLWLNRRIQEEMAVDIYCEVKGGIPQIDHVIDFTERIRYKDNEYYLVSNTVNLTSTQYVQHLNLIRWY